MASNDINLSGSSKGLAVLGQRHRQRLTYLNPIRLWRQATLANSPELVSSSRVPETDHVKEAPTFTLSLSLPLDGMRGVSILLVLVAHIQLLEPKYRFILTGGLLGVDAFFVISGFLITSLLLEEYRTLGTISLKRFYIRRGLRLLPALTTVVLLTCLMGLAIGSLMAVGLTGFRLLSIAGYFMNWVRAFEAPRPWFLGHLWSLSVEEQFYLVWPAILVLLVRQRRPRECVCAFLLVCLGASFFLKPALYLRGADVQRLFFASDTRAEPILIGCLLAVLLHWWKIPALLRRKSNTWIAIVVTLVLMTVADRDFESMYYLGGLTLFAIATALIILRVVLDSRARTTRALSWPPLVWIGKRSYGIYLWHWPMFRLSRIIAPADALAFLSLAIASTFCLATLSFRYVEAPFLKLKTRFSPGRRVGVFTETARLAPSSVEVSAYAPSSQ